MSIVVQKYGGSSVASVAMLKRVAEKVVETKARGHQVVVVISAMGKRTDELLGLAREMSDSPPRRELDMLLSTGERVSMALLSMAIQKHGFDAISFTGSQSGIITNDRHFEARIISVRPHRVEDELARGKIVIVAGYQGMSYKREITTLGRGGSDTTALAMAAALGAERAEIYSDVDGVFSADPRVVEDAVHLPTLSYEQMQEMAVAGASVLHSAAVDFARRAGIEIHARSTFKPGRETRVVAGASASPSVVGRKLDLLCTAENETAFDRALEPLASAGGHAIEIHFGSEVSFIVPTADIPDCSALEAQLGEVGVSVQRDVGTVSIIGLSAGDLGPRILQINRHLRDASIQPLRTTAGPLRVSALVASQDVDKATRLLHGAYVRRTNDEDSVQ